MTGTPTRVRASAQRAAYARTMAMPLERTDHRAFPVVVTDVTEVTAHLRRLTLAAPELGGYRPLGPDEYFGLVMPRGDRPLPDLPRTAGADLRVELAKLPERHRPDLRWYTVRAHRPDAGELDVEVVTHGDEGPGSRWVRAARPGLTAGFQTGSSCYRLGSSPGDQALVGDETAWPALSGILQRVGPDVRPHVVLEVPGPGVVPALPPVVRGTVTVVERGADAPGTAALAALREADLPTLSFGWACGEQQLAAQVRRHLVTRCGLDRRAVYFCAYWVRGRARG